MLDLMKKLIREEEGQGMVEYGLILALVSIVVIGVLTAIGGNKTTGLKGKFNDVLKALGGTEVD